MEPEAYRILPRAIWQRISKDFDQAIFLSNIFFIKKIRKSSLLYTLSLILPVMKNWDVITQQ